MVWRSEAWVLLAALSLFLVGPPASAEDSGGSTGELCAFELEESGTAAIGKRFRAERMITGVDAKTALARVARQLVREGYADVTVNLEVGFATCNRLVATQGAAQVPISVLVEKLDGGTRVELVYTLFGGNRALKGKLKEEFCTYFRAAGGVPPA